jgi:hypothetical protein
MADEEPRANHSNEVVDIPFYGDLIEAARDMQSGTVHVSIRRVCDNLCINFNRQLQQLKDYHWATVNEMSTVAQDGKQRELAFLPLAQVPAWMMHINHNKVGGGP